MKKALWIAGGVLAAVAVGIGIWFLIGNLSQKGATNQTVEPAPVERTDFTNTNETAVAVNIKDLSFSPPNIKVKSGTKVTWTNLDTMNHSVLAEDPDNPGDLPLKDTLFGKNETFSITFNKLGTFKYMCGPHTFMHGTVEVVE
jgi:amicyanin